MDQEFVLYFLQVVTGSMFWRAQNQTACSYVVRMPRLRRTLRTGKRRVRKENLLVNGN